MTTTNKDILNQAIKLLARREHSQLELLRKLKVKGYSASEIKEVLNSLQSTKTQSDARFCEAYIHMRVAKGYGPLRIRAELQQRGIADALIEEYLAQSSGFWREQLQKVLRKRFPGDFDVIAAMRFLQYRGFAIEDIKKAVKVMEEEVD